MRAEPPEKSTPPKGSGFRVKGLGAIRGCCSLGAGAGELLTEFSGIHMVSFGGKGHRDGRKTNQRLTGQKCPQQSPHFGTSGCVFALNPKAYSKSPHLKPYTAKPRSLFSIPSSRAHTPYDSLMLNKKHEGPVAAVVSLYIYIYTLRNDPRP